MVKQGIKDFSDILEDTAFINRQQDVSTGGSLRDFDPKILYIALFYAEDRDVFLKATHKHEFSELAYLAKGECQVEYGGTSFPLRQGEAVIYPPNVSHVEKPLDTNNIELYFMGFSNIDLSDFIGKREGDEANVIHTRKLAGTVTDLFREAMLELKNKLPFHPLILSNLGSLIILHLLRLSAPQQTKFISKDCRFVVDYIDRHFREEINLDTLAEKIYLSKHYLSHLFKEEMGVSPIKYLTQKRLEESKRLLRESDLPITKIAATVGYADPIYFSQFFKKQMGCSPNEYRSTEFTPPRHNYMIAV